MTSTKLTAGSVAVPAASAATAAPASTAPLSAVRGVALYVGALLGPGLLMLPGLAAALAGPASVLAWAGLLGASGLFALIFTVFGIRLRGGGGVVTYATAGLGPRAGRAVGWCFLTAVVLGAPVVCMIGAGYVTALIGGGRQTTALVAALLLVAVTALTLAGARIGTAVQMVLVGLLLAVIVAAVAGSLHAARSSNWTPFAPHGWSSVGSAASVLMLSFVGWEAVAPLTRRLANPARTLPRVTAVAFAVTAVVYLALAVTVIAVLGPRAGGAVPVADLLRIAVGSAGPAIAASAAVLLTLATVNAYLTGAAVLAAHLRDQGRREAGAAVREEAGAGRARVLFLAIGAAGVLELTAEALGVLDSARMVALPTTLFLVVYIAATASAARIMRGWLRAAAVAGCAASVAVLACSGAPALLAVALGVAGFVVPARHSRVPQAAVPSEHIVQPEAATRVFEVCSGCAA